MTMNTLEMLRNGELLGSKKLSLSCDLDRFPVEIMDLSDTLEILDLSRNRLSTLPDDFGKLKKLRILFLSENDFEVFPEVLADCPNLTMIGFKSNKISHIPENAFPLKTQWLILTDNKIKTLPESIGELTQLQKCMLAGNNISILPDTMASCRSLELLRLSANDLEKLPRWLFELPRLSWLACAGNPCINRQGMEEKILQQIDWDDITLHEELGKGASGVISRVTLLDKEEAFAIKIFKGEVTSDGYPLDEMQACIEAGKHKNLITLHAKLNAHPEEKEGLLLSLIPPRYVNLGNPPDFETCTRDTYDEQATFLFSHIVRIANDIASASWHLHHKNIMHGDLYAHNILIDENGDSLLGDFGAATLYENISELENEAFERIEVRAFGCLLEDLLDRYIPEDDNVDPQEIMLLRKLQVRCMDEEVSQRPLFTEVMKVLEKITFPKAVF